MNTREVFFEHTAWCGTTLPVQGATNPAPKVPIYTVPAGFSSGEIRSIGVDGEPIGLFYGSVSWTIRAGDSNAQELLTSSSLGVASFVGGQGSFRGGLRFGPLGSFSQPRELRMKIRPGQVIQLVFVGYVAPANPLPINILVRLGGVLYGNV